MITSDEVIRDSLMKCIKDALNEVNTTCVDKIPTGALNDLYLYCSSTLVQNYAL